MGEELQGLQMLPGVFRPYLTEVVSSCSPKPTCGRRGLFLILMHQRGCLSACVSRKSLIALNPGRMTNADSQGDVNTKYVEA